MIPQPPRLAQAYRRLFAVDEIAASPVLRRLFWVVLLGFFVTFFDWAAAEQVTVHAAATAQHRCWPYFQSCGDLYFLETSPLGHSQTTVYALLYAATVGAAAAALTGRHALAHALMLLLLAWKLFVYFVLTMALVGNYHHFHLLLAVVFLCFPHKLYFLRRTLVVLYFLSATVKLHEGWILGSYFTSLHLGLPLIPDALAPLATNAVIALELLGAPLLLSTRPRLQRAAVVAFTAFHLYSITLVKFMYPTMVLLPLLVLFVPRPEPAHEPPPRGRAAAPGFALLALLFAAQSISFLIPGDAKMTLEGNFYGLYMFEANHQCVSTVAVHRRDGHVERRRDEWATARERCDPYRPWFQLAQVCKRHRDVVARIAWSYDHSINGGPFYRIVEVDDACSLRYRAFAHNPWIRDPSQGARIVGYPVKNVYE